jgi:hypothetical protein
MNSTTYCFVLEYTRLFHALCYVFDQFFYHKKYNIQMLLTCFLEIIF